ncbi:MAG: hypothetical protein HeimC3_29490 [Candidatus Heimdallarchaeota archaeon LC_3]|nr:MAG: hypothetical protein HeimC3_29490 [Candidatus Heimdallarchaeota archaeon LC_3]
MQKLANTININLIRKKYDIIDQKIVSTMDKYGVDLLRIAMGIVFIWFGILKPLGLSPAERLANELVAAGASWIPGNEYFYTILAIIEIFIGIFFLFRGTVRIAIFLLVIQMPLTILPLILLPNISWQIILFVPTLEGQYIIKNLVLISAAIVIGGKVRKFDAERK